MRMAMAGMRAGSGRAPRNPRVRKSGVALWRPGSETLLRGVADGLMEVELLESGGMVLERRELGEEAELDRT